MLLQTEKKILVTLAVVSVILLGLFYVLASVENQSQSQSTPPLSSSIPPTGYSKAATSTATLVTTASTLVQATSTGRNYLELDTTGSNVYCNMDNGNKASLYSGVYIASSTKYVISADTDNLYRGAIYCISGSGQSATTTVFGF